VLEAADLARILKKDLGLPDVSAVAAAPVAAAAASAPAAAAPAAAEKTEFELKLESFGEQKIQVRRSAAALKRIAAACSDVRLWTAGGEGGAYYYRSRSQGGEGPC
jgi:ribosomal protein L7/L12